MRILFVTGEYPPLKGGIADYTQHLAEALASRGVEVGVMTSPGAEPAPGSPVQVFPVVPAWGFSTWPALRRAAARYDIVHIQYQAANFQLKGAIPLLPEFFRLTRGPRVVTTFHDLRVPYLFPKAGRLRHWAIQRLARASSSVITTNGEDEAALRAWGIGEVKVTGTFHSAGRPAGSLVQIPLGTNIPQELPSGYNRAAWRARWGVAPDQFLVAHFGFVNSSKGIPDLLRAQDRLLRAGQAVKLLFLGEKLGASDPTNADHLAEIESLIAELQLDEGWTIWTGALPPDEIAAGLHASDLVCLPYRDGASLRRTTLITALAHGRPVVSTQPAVPTALLEDNRTLSLARRSDAADLARRLALLLRYPPSLDRLARGAAEVAPHFDWQRIGQAHLDFYRDVTGRGNSATE